jgi:hypothetical protein
VAVGATLDPLDGLFEGLDLQDREAATSSLASVKGPSTTVRDLPENLTRAPLELGWRPSRASRMQNSRQLSAVSRQQSSLRSEGWAHKAAQARKTASP